MFKDGEPREHSNPNLQYANTSIPPKFLFNNESDPQGINISNNSNLTHSYIFQNFDISQMSEKNGKVNNLSKATNMNLDFQNYLKPNISNFTNNLLHKNDINTRPNQDSNDLRQSYEPDRNIQINLTVQNPHNSNPIHQNSKTIDLQSLNEPVNITTQRGKKLMIEVTENGSLVVNQLDNLSVFKTTNTSHSREISVRLAISMINKARNIDPNSSSVFSK